MLLTLDSLTKVCERIEQGRLSDAEEINRMRQLLDQQRVHVHALLWRTSYFKLKPLFATTQKETKRQLIAAAFSRWEKALKERNNTMSTITAEKLKAHNKPFYESILASDDAIETDCRIITERMQKLDRLTVMRVGDFVRLKDGTMRRIANNWGDVVQLTMPGINASFYLGDGYLDYSGALDSPIPIQGFQKTEEAYSGFAWIFHQDAWGAGRGVHALVPFRVYQEV